MTVKGDILSCYYDIVVSMKNNTKPLAGSKRHSCTRVSFYFGFTGKNVSKFALGRGAET